MKHTLKYSDFCSEEAKNNLLNDECKLFKNLQEVLNYDEILDNLLPNASATLILQISNDKRFFYVGKKSYKKIISNNY
jgi:hypothetical protein